MPGGAGGSGFFRNLLGDHLQPDDSDPGGGEPPLNGAGKAAYEKNRAGLRDGSIIDKARKVCTPDGLPRVLATPYPFTIYQVPAGQVTFVYEMNHQLRVIFIDKPLPEAHRLLVEPLYNGHSVGHWDGDNAGGRVRRLQRPNLP
jgi:hypothetical protein